MTRRLAPETRAPVRLRMPKGVHTIYKRRPDGTQVAYTYAWRGGPRMESAPGTAEFLREYAEVVEVKGRAAIRERAARIKMARMREKLDSIEKRVFDRARSNGREHDLPAGWAMEMFQSQGGRCAISGLNFRPTRGNTDPLSPSADRIDNAKGYTADNVHLVCLAVNIGKGTMDMREYVRICSAVARKGGAQNG